jgi:Spy/CpxP family protein refolding chaperone
MFGTVIGTMCLVGLVGMAARPRGRWDRRGRWGHHHGGPGRGGWARVMMERVRRALRLRDDQDEVLEEVWKEARSAGRGLAEALRDGRGDVAAAVRGERLDQARLDALFEVQDEAIRSARRALTEALRKGHAALEPEQREALSDLIAGRTRGWV